MPFSTSHRYLTFGGTLPGGEQWQSGVRMAPQGVVTYGDGAQDDQLSALAGVVTDWFESAQISPRALLTWVKQAIIGTDGAYVTAPGIVEINPAVPGGSSSTGGVVPNQICLVATLLTGTSFGDAQRGRIYLPMPAAIPDTDGKIPASIALLVAQATSRFFEDLNALWSGTLPEKVSVMSRKGSGTTRQVTEVSVGLVLDTQRSRRENLDEGPRQVVAVA